MSGHRLEVADVIRNDAAAYLERYRPSKEQRRVLIDLAECRTSVLGGHLKKCDLCGHEVPVYNSCQMGSDQLWGDGAGWILKRAPILAILSERSMIRSP